MCSSDLKRKLWKEKGYLHYEHLTDEELTESPFQTIFPNIAFGASADGLAFFRWEPHATDPEKCYFDLWIMAYPVAGMGDYVQRTASEAVKFEDRKSTRLNSSHKPISYAVFCLKKKKIINILCRLVNQ